MTETNTNTTVSDAKLAEVAKKEREAVEAEIARLRSENEALKARSKSKRTITIKVSQKGAVSVYGLGRFPVTLYREQWEALDKAMPAVRDFIVKHSAQLKVKE